MERFAALQQNEINTFYVRNRESVPTLADTCASRGLRA